MPQLQYSGIHIAALTCAVPSNIQKINLDPNSPSYTYLKSFVRQMGISQRHISLTEQTCADTGYVAAVEAIKRAGIKPEEIDAVVFLTQTPDFNPGTSNSILLQHRLGLRKDVMAFDVPLGCSAFPYGLSICSSLMQQPTINKVLMLIGDSHWCDFDNKEELLKADKFLNGESTTATILDKEGDDVFKTELYTDGSGYKYLFRPSLGIRNSWRKFKKAKLPNGTIIGTGEYMDGIEITSFATSVVVDYLKKYLESNNKSIDDYDGVVLHQANKQIVKTIAKRLNVDLSKVPMSLDRYGNTDGATITTTIADAYANQENKKLKLLTCAFGVGLSWGIAEITIETKNIVPIIEVSDSKFGEAYVEPIE
ncbi:MAG: ketoacyl-ACP synthase III [Succinivibrio sp.]|nr:ketoacyl-ACP synthase III [Succinivibrio sp.]